jgi:S1-C subfamily serine protease
MASAHTGSRLGRRWSHLLIIGIVGIALLALTIVFAVAALADNGPGGDVQNPVILDVQIARPAVVRIVETYNIQLQLNLCGNQAGTYSGSFGASGSGAFISSHGDILTAGHVVTDPVGDVSAFAPTIAADIQRRCHQSATADDVIGAYLQDPTSFSITYSNQVNSVYLSTAYVGSYSASRISGVQPYPFTLVGMSSELQNDVAVIHVNLSDTPSIPIGDVSTVSPTDTLTEIGFPGNGDLAPLNDLQDQTPNNFFASSVNDLTVSAIKTNSSGGELIQVGGNVEHGDSGGPCLNAQGQVVGVVSFSESDTGGTAFLQAVSSAKPYLSGIDTTPGKFETLWRQALTAYASTAPGHWHQAVPLLQQFAQSYPQFGAVKPYLQYAQQQEASEPVASSQSNNQVIQWLNRTVTLGMDLAGLGGLALLILIVSLIVGARRRAAARRAVLVPVAVPAGVPNGGMSPMAIPSEPVSPQGRMTLPSMPATPPWLTPPPQGAPYSPVPQTPPQGSPYAAPSPPPGPSYPPPSPPQGTAYPAQPQGQPYPPQGPETRPGNGGS